MLKEILTNGVLYTFIVVAAAIIIDTVLGAIKAAVVNYDVFDLRTLPKFLGTGILPFVGGLGILALAAEFVGDPFAALFYAAAAAVTLKYMADIKDKLVSIFGVRVGDGDSVG